MRCLWIILVLLGSVTLRYVKDQSIRRWIHTLPVPWVGVLSHKHDRDSNETVAGIILISTGLAVGNAYEVSVIKKIHIRNTTKAMFLTIQGKVQYSTVADYIIHPEFDENTLNTFALIMLEYDEKDYKWQLPQWPKEYSQMSEYPGDVYFLGYTDRNKALEQIMYKMERVNESECSEFYKSEKLDNKWMAPTAFQCYRKVYRSDPCVLDSGMALAVLNNGKWTLLGMSVLGPGCLLPARFVQFSQFVPWVLVTTRSSRRMPSIVPGIITTWPHYDKILMQQLTNNSIVMRPYEDEEIIYGNCTKFDGEQIYREQSSFKASYYGTGIYGLSVWDEAYYNITCARLTVECLERTIRPFSFNFALAQYNEDFDGMVKSIPMVKVGDSIGPKIMHISDGPWISWWYRTSHAKTNNIVFKFDFYKEATISLEIYGPLMPEPDSEEERHLAILGDETIDTYNRPRRPNDPKDVWTIKDYSTGWFGY